MVPGNAIVGEFNKMTTVYRERTIPHHPRRCDGFRSNGIETFTHMNLRAGVCFELTA